MKIGIVGAGNIGGTLARRLGELGHDVKVANSRGPETLADFADAKNVTPVWAKDAADDADLVILSIPQKNVPDLAPGLFSAAKPGAPLIETNNYYPQQRDGLIEKIEAGQPESAWVAEHLGTPVIKAFNGIWWKHLLESGKPAGTEGRIALPIAGAEGDQKTLVFEVIDALGFDPVDAGTIDESWRQQPGTPVYGKDFGIDDTVEALAEASTERAPEWKA